LNVLIACEFTGTVRDAFKERGHFAVSCDIIPTESEGYHIQTDVREILDYGWDLMIGHPPCTYLSYAGRRWMSRPGRKEKMLEAIEFFKTLLEAPIPKIAIENPNGYSWEYIRKPNQIVQPFYFGEPAQKSTGLWLKNLPLLIATNVLDTYEKDWTSNRHTSKIRSKTFKSIARAMAEQWG
jgi:site-specific DNA-cytosine methylase